MQQEQRLLRIISRQQEIIRQMVEMEKELINELSQYRSVELEEKRIEEMEALV